MASARKESIAGSQGDCESIYGMARSVEDLYSICQGNQLLLEGMSTVGAKMKLEGVHEMHIEFLSHHTAHDVVVNDFVCGNRNASWH